MVQSDRMQNNQQPVAALKYKAVWDRYAGRLRRDRFLNRSTMA